MSAAFKRELYVTVLLLAIGPALIAIHPEIPFVNDGSCDPWYVFGLFYYFPDATHWSLEGGGIPRQVARLPYVIPGYLLTKAFKGITTDYLLFFMFYSSSVFLLYRTVRALINAKVAVFAAIFFAVHPLIVANYSVTFASPAIFYCILSLYLVVRAMEADKRIVKLGALFGSGLAMGAALHVHLGIVVYGITNYLIYFIYVSFYSSKSIEARIWHLLQAACAVLAGIVVVSAALGGLAVLFGGSFSLIFKQFLYLSDEFSDYAQQWLVPDWYVNGGIGGILAATLLLSGINIYLFTSRTRKVTQSENVRRHVLATSWAVLILTIICLIYGLLGGSIIQYHYYYVFFVPYLSIIIFSPLLCLRNGKSRATDVWAILFLICGILASALNEDFLDWLHLSPVEAIASVGAAVAAASVYGFLIVSKKRRPALSILYGAAVLLMLVIVRPDGMGSAIWTNVQNQHYAMEYQRIRQGLALLSRIPFKTYPKFWVDMETGSTELSAYPRSYFSCTFQRQFPGVDPGLWNASREFRFEPGEDVVIISGSPGLRSRADDGFAALGLAASEVADVGFAAGDRHYEFLVEHILGSTTPSSSFRPRVIGEPPLDAEKIQDVYRRVDDLESGSKNQDRFPIEVRTPDQPWAYGAEFQRFKRVKGPVWIRVRADVRSGPVGIGILDQQGGDFISRELVTQQGAVTVDLYVVRPEISGYLVIQSWNSGKSADITINDITVLTLPTNAHRPPG